MVRIPIAGPWITEKEVAYVADAAANAWYANANLYHERFERAFAESHGVRHAVALPSCTSAIHLSLLALGVGPGHEVIVPEETWIGSSAPATYVGAAPVFADVDARGWCMDPASVEACVTPRTRAIVAVGLYGNMPDMDALRAIADRHGIALVEDAAQSIGARYHGRPAGTLGHTGVYSFHGTKTLTTGEGGMLVTDDEALYRRVLFLRDHGRASGEIMFWNTEVAWKYRMSSLQAALGLAQLERLDELVERKRRIFQWYRARLEGTPGLTLNWERPGTRSTHWMSTVVLDPALGIRKEPLMAALRERGIDTRPFFYPLSSLPAYADHPQAERARARNRVAYAISPHGVNLPSPLNLTEQQADYVCAQLLEVLHHAAAPSRPAGVT